MSQESLPPVQQTVNLTEKVHDALIVAIVSEHLEPGELYSIKELAEQFGVSRTPVREAMLQLARRGLVEIVRNQGVRILERSLVDLESIFELRLWVEVPAIRKTAVRISDDDYDRLMETFGRMRDFASQGDGSAMEREDRHLHFTMLEVSGNLRAARMIDDLRDFVLSRGQTTSGRSRSLLAIVDEHVPILDGLKNRNPDAAAAGLQSHIEQTRDYLLNQQRDIAEKGSGEV